MNAVLNWFYTNIREDFGCPVSLKRLLAQHPNIRIELPELSTSISAGNVPLWHELGEHTAIHWAFPKPGVLNGWRASGNRYESFQIVRPEYLQIGRKEVIENWTCDISEIFGFSASKSELHNFEHTDAMVEANSSDMIDEISHEKLAENLAHTEIRIIHSPSTSDHFAHYLWDGRFFLINCGGSHHFAAAKYIAARLPAAVALRGKLITYSLNAAAIASLRQDFEMFVISNDATASCGFSAAMRACKATWLWHYMPRPFEHTQAILLPKNEGRSIRVAKELYKADILDFGGYLANLAARQNHR